MTTTGLQKYTGPITLSVDDTLTGKNITFSGTTTTINGAHNLIISDVAGTTIYGGKVGNSAPLLSLTDTSKTIDINGGLVTTNGYQTYDCPVTLTLIRP